MKVDAVIVGARLLALLLMVDAFRRGSPAEQREIDVQYLPDSLEPEVFQDPHGRVVPGTADDRSSRVSSRRT